MCSTHSRRNIELEARGAQQGSDCRLNPFGAALCHLTSAIFIEAPAHHKNAAASDGYAAGEYRYV